MAQSVFELPGHAMTADETDRVLRIEGCSLRVAPTTWDWASANAEAIDRHWQRRSRESPAMFNGVIHMLSAISLDGAHLHGNLVRADFKSFLYWREHGHPYAGVRDAFGSALIISAEGHVMLGRQRPGNINSGLAYLPGGFIDPSDISPAGTIDIAGSIERELAEEAGLAAADADIAPGFIATFDGPQLSIAQDIRIALPAQSLRERILDHIAKDQNPELADIVIVRSEADLLGLAMAPYATRLLKWYFTSADANTLG